MQKQRVYALGIDLGGTKTLAAIVDVTTGEVVSSERKRTRADKGQEYVSQNIINLSTAALESAKLPAGAKIIGVGIGAAGQIDRKNGVVVDAPNLGVKDMPMAEILGKQFGKPVAVGNDVEVAALGEYLYGSGREYATFVVLFVGTGLGGGIVQDGRLYSGLTGTAGEVGHMTIQAGGRIWPCGSQGCLEEYSFRNSIHTVIIAEIHHGLSSVLTWEPEVQLTEAETIIRSGLLANA